jgi:biphenyl-2,3-diol 1,2-dioxygenase
MPVSSLAYLGVGVADVPAWAGFATDVLGLEPSSRGPDGETRFRSDEHAWRLAVHRSEADDIIYAGFDVPDARALTELTGHLRTMGVSARALTSAEAAARGVMGGAAVRDPDGLAIELVHGLHNAPEPYSSPRGATFVTGSQGLGHVVLTTANVELSLKFYGALGFGVSDYIKVELAPGLTVNLVFLHCNARHHTVALLPVPMPKRLNHLMLEVASVDMVLRAYYRAQARGAPIVRHIGRHTNDHMFSFYAQTPAGFDVEYGFGARHVGPGWTVEQYSAISLWGHDASCGAPAPGGAS